MNRAVQTVCVPYGGLEGTCCQTYVTKSNGESQNITPYAKNKLEENNILCIITLFIMNRCMCIILIHLTLYTLCYINNGTTTLLYKKMPYIQFMIFRYVIYFLAHLIPLILPNSGFHSCLEVLKRLLLFHQCWHQMCDLILDFCFLYNTIHATDYVEVLAECFSFIP